MSLRMLISGAFLSVINCLIHNINCKHFKLYIYMTELSNFSFLDF